MKRTISMFIGWTMLGSLLLAGCSKETFNPENVLSKALETDEDIAYYGELTGAFNGIEEIENVSMREWQTDQASRVEMDTSEGLVSVVADDDKVTIYEEASQTVYTTEDDDLGEFQLDPREQLDMVLDLVKDTHETKHIGEEEIAGRPAIHLQLNKREGEKSLFGNQEIWIDKEHWLVLKMISASGNTKNEVAYETIDFDADIDPSLFELDVPEGVETKRLDASSDNMNQEISLKDVPDKLGEGVLYFPDNETHEVATVTYLETAFDSGRIEVNVDYTRDEAPLFMFTAMEQTDMDQGAEDVFTESMHPDKIRGHDAIVNDSGDFRAISWSEGEYDYSMVLMQPDVSWEEVKAWAEDMEVIK